MDRVLGTVFAILMGLISLGVTVYLTGVATDTLRSRKFDQDLNLLAMNVRAQYRQSQSLYANFANANVSQLIKYGDFPDDMVNKNGALVDKWNYPVTIAPATSVGGVANDAFSVTFGQKFTTGLCAEVVASLTGYLTLDVGGVVFTPATSPDTVSAMRGCLKGTTIVATYQ